MKKLRILTFLAFVFATLISANCFASNGNGNNAGFSPNQVKGIQKIVHDYLMNNPQILVEVSQVLQKQQAAQAEKDAMTAIQKLKQPLFSSSKTPSAGNPNANVYIVEFFDYQCGHCKTMAPIISSILKNNKNVKVIFKELPIFGGASRFAAQVALASVAQGKYYAFHNALLAATTPLNRKNTLKIAKSVGLNTTKLEQNLSAPWIQKELRSNFDLARNLKLAGTPAFVIANRQMTKFRFIPGATSPENIEAQIKAVE